MRAESADALKAAETDDVYELSRLVKDAAR